MVEKSDEFDECVLNRQSFPTKILHLAKKISVAYFMYGYNLLTWVCQDLSRYVGTWNLEVLLSDYP